MLERPHQPRNRAGEQVPFGLLVAGDLTISGDRAFRIAEEVRHHAAQGRRVGLVQAARPASDSRIAPEVQTCVRRGLAEVVDPAAGPASALLVVHGPAEIAWSERSLAGIRAERTLLVVHDRRDYAVAQLRRRLRGSGTIVWAPTTPWLRDAAPSGAALAADDWLPPVGELSAGSTARRAGPPALGWIETHGMRDLPLPEGVDAYHLPSGAVPLHSLPEGAIDASQLSLDRLARLDGLACFPDQMAGPFPETLLRSALRRGAVVLLPQWLERHFGRGPRYCTPEAAMAELAAMLEAGGRKRRRNRRPAATPDRGAPSSAAISRRPRPVMFLASNGVGIGHLTRLLAIARRLDPRCP